MQKRADTNESFKQGWGKADFYVAGDPNAGGGKGIRTIVTAADGTKMKRQVGGRVPTTAGSIRVNPTALNLTNTTNRNVGRTDQT